MHESVQKEGWKKWSRNLRNQAYSDAPKQVRGVPRLEDDLKALWLLLSGKEPAKRLVRGSAISEVLYGFGDASGLGFGSTWSEVKTACEDSLPVGYRIGIWKENAQCQSSNFKELGNLVETLEGLGKEGNLEGREIFLFTDNSTAELAHHKGNSGSRLLFDWIVRLRNLNMKYGTKLHLVHVSGTRMISQGTDSVSRGNLEDVFQAKEMLEHIPFNETAIERCSELESWIRKWAGDNMEVLSPMDWYYRGHDLDGGHYDQKGFWRNKTRMMHFAREIYKI